MLLSDCEGVLELNEAVEIETHILSMAAIEWWMGQKVAVEWPPMRKWQKLKGSWKKNC